MNKENKIKVIFHMGATKKENKKAPPVLKEDHGLVDWNSDIRGTITFDDAEDIASKRDQFSDVVKDWLAIK